MTVSFEATRPDDYLARLAASDLGRAYKTLVREELGIRPGDRVLDLGCGPGADLGPFAEAVGSTGSVLGLDHDETAVRDARQAVSHLPQVRVLEGDIHSLDLPDSSVDRAHTDRVLQHVADPRAVLDEVRRVLRIGGRAALAEPDWDTLVIDYPDASVSDMYRRFITDRVVRNARIGRQLPRLAAQAGLTVSRVVPVTAVFHEAEQADQVLGFRRVTDRAVKHGYLSEATARKWLSYLAGERFFAAATLFVVVAERQ